MSPHHIRTNAHINLSVTLGRGLVLTARLARWAVAEGIDRENHRAQRSLRSRAMLELALAWADPGLRQAGSDRRGVTPMPAPSGSGRAQNHGR